MRLKALLTAALATGALFALAARAVARPTPASPAAAGPNTDPVRFWSLSRSIRVAATCW
jgi:hypothetical protein